VFPNANFAGEVTAAKRFAKVEKIQLKVVPGLKMWTRSRLS
jgi:hypothetical protein